MVELLIRNFFQYFPVIVMVIAAIAVVVNNDNLSLKDNIGSKLYVTL